MMNTKIRGHPPGIVLGWINARKNLDTFIKKER